MTLNSVKSPRRLRRPVQPDDLPAHLEVDAGHRREAAERTVIHAGRDGRRGALIRAGSAASASARSSHETAGRKSTINDDDAEEHEVQVRIADDQQS
jgi:hypothetical protein